MKFLCIECDEAMKLNETRGPEDGSMTVIFGCPSCGKNIAMLTNAMETQMVHSLGVKVGGRTEPTKPMETLRSSLVNSNKNITPEAVDTAPGPSNENDAESESKCPFSGMVAEAMEKEENTLTWTAEAEERLKRIPFFVRSMVRKSIEKHAQEQGLTEINAAVMDEMKNVMGM